MIWAFVKEGREGGMEGGDLLSADRLEWSMIVTTARKAESSHTQDVVPGTWHAVASLLVSARLSVCLRVCLA